MKKAKKVVALALCAVMLVVGSVAGTMAYLSSTTDVVTNTFTFGKVAITLDEADVDEYGVEIKDAERVTANTYKLMPGHTYVKDPTVHVKGDSEPSYVRMQVTVNGLDELKAAFPSAVSADGTFLLQNFVDWNSDVWAYESYSNGVYEFRYNGVVTVPNGTDADAYYDLTPLFESITIPEAASNADLDKLAESFDIAVVAHAIQADGFDDATEAWNAFDAK